MSFDFKGPVDPADLGVPATLIDASAGLYTETLPAATGSGRVIQWVLQDATNAATVVPAVGESINGLTDGVFTFTNYGAGTIFLAVDRGAGAWEMTVQGASTQKAVGRFTYEIDNGAVDLVNHTAAGDGSYGAADVVPLSAANVTRAGVFDVVGNTLVCNTEGEYEVHAEFLLFDSGGADSTAVYAYVGDGTSQIGFAIHDRTGANLYGNASKTFTKEFQVGDVLDFRIATPSTEDASCRGLLVDVREVTSTKTVLAGMVPVQELHVFSTTRRSISTANMNATPLNFDGDAEVAGQDNTYDPQGLFSGNIVTIQQSGLYEIFASASNQDFAALLSIQVDGANIVDMFSNSGSTSGLHTAMAGKTFIELVAGQTVNLSGNGFNTGNGVTFSVQQIASASVSSINTTDIPADNTGVADGDTLVWNAANGQYEPAASAQGLRGEPVADNTALTALAAKNYELRKVLADGKEYVFELGATSGTLADDAATGFWVEVVGVSRFEVSITATDGTNPVNVNGAASAIGYSGTSMRVGLAVPTDQALSTVVADNGCTAVISDQFTGAIELIIPAGTSGPVVLTAAFVPSLSDVFEVTTIAGGATASTTSTAWSDVPGSGFTIPSPGVWEIMYNLYVQNSLTSTNGNDFKLVDVNTGLDVPRSFARFSTTTNSVGYQNISQVVVLTVSQATAYKLQWKTSSNGTLRVSNAPASGHSKIVCRRGGA